MPTTDKPPGEPPRPTETVTLHEFGARLRDLREWSKLTLVELAARHETLKVSTSSDYERGNKLPRREWVHTFVTVCIRHRRPGATRTEIDAELAHWVIAWTNIQHHRTGHTPAPAIPARQPTNPETRQPTVGSTPAPVPLTNQAPVVTPAATPDCEPRRRGTAGLPRRRAWLAIGAAAALVVAGGITATATGVFDRTPGAATTTAPPASLSGSTVPAPAVHASGTVEALRGVEGVDLDTNNRADQNDPGIDISFAATSTHLNAMAERVNFTVLPESPLSPERRYCVQAVDWMHQIPGIYDLAEGRNICVMTDEGRFSMLTITRRATDATGTISFRYTTWA